MNKKLLKNYPIEGRDPYTDPAEFKLLNIQMIKRYEFAKKFCKGLTLDAACGPGYGSQILKEKADHIIGIDNSGEQIKQAQNKYQNERIEYKIVDMEGKIPFDDSSFDTIVSLETIEHIKDDGKLLRDFFDILNHEGKLLLTAPYKFYKRLPGDNISDIEDGGHVRWGYTHEEMKNLLNEAGFEVCKMEYVTGMISQNIIRVERMLSKIFPYRLAWIIVFPFRFLVLFDFLLTKIFRYPYLSIAVVAEKKSL